MLFYADHNHLTKFRYWGIAENSNLEQNSANNYLGVMISLLPELFLKKFETKKPHLIKFHLNMIQQGAVKFLFDW